MLKIAIVEKCPIFKAGLTSYLSEFPEFNIVNYKSVVLPDVILVRANQATPDLFAEYNAAQWVVILDEITQAKSWLAQGVKGLVTRMIEPFELESIIQRVAEGQCVVSLDIQANLMSVWEYPENSSEFQQPLTRREQEVLELVTQGLSNAQIAENLAISLSTVKGHISRMLEKLGANNRTQLIYWTNSPDDLNYFI